MSVAHERPKVSSYRWMPDCPRDTSREEFEYYSDGGENETIDDEGPTVRSKLTSAAAPSATVSGVVGTLLLVAIVRAVTPMDILRTR